MPLKLLDYGCPGPFGETVGGQRKLAWPVNAHRVTLPKPTDDRDGFNPFERVVLKMIDATGVREAEALARETCIPFALVQCVLLRLRDKAFIDEHNGIIEQRRHNWADREERPSSFVTALLFRELATGKILPFLHLLDEMNPLKRKEEDEKKYRRIRWNDEHKDNPPTPRDVIAALRMMKKRAAAFDGAARLPAVRHVTIAEEPEPYHLECPIAIQRSDGEFRIADPFGNGFSLVLENAFSRLLEQDEGLGHWMMDWRQRLANPQTERQAETPKQPYHNDANLGKYPKLVLNLRLKRNRQHRSIGQIYAGLEWALFYACARHPYDAVIKKLRLANLSDHPELLRRAAERIGLRLPQRGLRPVLRGKLDDFLSGEAEMGTVLSLSLLQAEQDDRHPLRRVAVRHQDLIPQIFQIKKKRDAQSHGDERAQRGEAASPDEDFMREIVTTLLPTMEFSGTPAAEADKDAATDSLFDARTSIQGEFGFKLFNRLGANLQDGLISAEEFWLFCKDGDNAGAFAEGIATALQMTLRRNLSGSLPPEIRETEYFTEAEKKATQAGLGQLPTSLCTVNPSRIQSTLQGVNETLGACVVAFLIVAEAEALGALADRRPSFLADIGDILQKRGHGNQPLPLTKEATGRLRKQAYAAIRALFEVQS